MKCQEFKDLIAAYLDETIPENRRDEFEQHFFACRSCFLGLKINENLQNKEVRITLKERTRWFVLRPVLVLSGFFLLIVISSILVMQNQQTRQLYQLSAFTPPPFHAGELRNGADTNVNMRHRFAEAIRLYENRQYRQALAQLERLPAAEELNPKIIFFRAVCHLCSDDLEKAGRALDVIIRSMDPAYFDEAMYLKGIVLLRQGQKQEAREQWHKLANMLSPMSRKAQAILARTAGLK